MLSQGRVLETGHPWKLLQEPSTFREMVDEASDEGLYTLAEHAWRVAERSQEQAAEPDHQNLASSGQVMQTSDIALN